MTEANIAFLSAVISLAALFATITFYFRTLKRNMTLHVYEAHRESLLVGLEHPHVLNWEPQIIGGRSPKENKEYYQYIFYILNVAEMAKYSESPMMQQGKLMDGYIKGHQEILRAMPVEITRTYSDDLRKRIGNWLPGSNWWPNEKN